MKRTSIFLTLALAAGLSAFLYRSASATAPAEGRADGTFFVTFQVPGLGPLNAIITAHGDGTVTSVDQTDFGLGGAAELNTASLGNWWRSGPLQTTDTRLTFGFDASGVPNGLAYRITGVVDWDPAFEVGNGTAYITVYNLALGEDPTDPNQGSDGGSLVVSAKRMH